MVKTNLLFIRVYRFLFSRYELRWILYRSIVWNWTAIVLKKNQFLWLQKRQQQMNKGINWTVWFQWNTAYSCSENFGFIFANEKSSIFRDNKRNSFDLLFDHILSFSLMNKFWILHRSSTWFMAAFFKMSKFPQADIFTFYAFTFSDFPIH